MRDQERCPVDARSPADLLAWVLEIGTRHGAVESIQLSCSPQSPRQIFCILDLKDGNAAAAARALGGTAFSAHTVACFVAVGADFSCPSWQDGTTARSCFDCAWRPAQAPGSGT